MSFFFSWRQSYGLEQLKMNPACLLRDSPYMNYSMAAPTLLPTGLLPRYSSVATTPVTTYQVSSNPAWMPQYIMQPGMPHVSTFIVLNSFLLITSLFVTIGMNEMLQANLNFYILVKNQCMEPCPPTFLVRVALGFQTTFLAHGASQSHARLQNGSFCVVYFLYIYIFLIERKQEKSGLFAC